MLATPTLKLLLVLASSPAAAQTLWVEGCLVRLLAVICCVDSKGLVVVFDETAAAGEKTEGRSIEAIAAGAAAAAPPPAPSNSGNSSSTASAKTNGLAPLTNEQKCEVVLKERVLAADIIRAMLQQLGRPVLDALRQLMPIGLAYKFMDGGREAVAGFDAGVKDSTPEFLWWHPCRVKLQQTVVELVEKVGMLLMDCFLRRDVEQAAPSAFC